MAPPEAVRNAATCSEVSLSEESSSAGESPRISGNSRKIACRTIARSSSICTEPLDALLPNRSMCPILVNDGATRVVMAQLSTIIKSGSRFWLANCRMICRLTSSGYLARRGSSIDTPALDALLSAAESYQGLRAASPPRDTTNDSARVVSTPSACIASDARNSRTEDRSTARPSAPRQKGVGPPPLSCISHRTPSGPSTSPTETALPSPYPLPVPNGQLLTCRCPMMDNAYGVAQESMFGTAVLSPEKNRANRSPFGALTSASSMPSRLSMSGE
mmetsp:Transcript_2302/g.10456  ORF Transcript_2302/g.10456 Transcript_2302/m.10456 type:complete len:275 (+) Transcript_2302:1139-1963(+)